MLNIQEFVRQKFPFLDVKEALKVISKTELRKLKVGEFLIEEGKVTNFTAYIIKGLFRAYVMRDGEERTVLFRKEMEFIGAPPSMFKQAPAQENVVAVEDSVVLIIDFVGFRKLARESMALSAAYTNLIEEMLLEGVERIQDFTTLSPEQRYLKFVDENKGLMNRIQLKHIASYIGVTEQSLSRIRARVATSKT